MNDSTFRNRTRCQSNRRLCSRSLGPVVVAALICGLILSTPVLALQLIAPPTIDAASRKTIGQFLTDDWPREPAHRKQSKATFEALELPNTEISIAYLINRLRHFQNRDALIVAEKLTANQPKSLDGWLIRAHLDALTDNFDQALIDLRSVKKIVADTPGLSDQQKLDTYRRVGQVLGYLQGPVKARLNPDLLNSTLDFVTQQAKDAELVALDAGRAEVLQRFDTLLKTQNEKTNQELEKQTTVNANLDVTLTNQNQQLMQSSQQLLARQTQLQTEASQRLADLTSRTSPLQSNLTSIAMQINAVQNDLQLLYTDLYNAQNVPPGYYSPVRFLTEQIRNRELTMYNLQSNAQATGNQLRSLEYQISQTQADYDSQILQLQQQHKKLEGTVLRNQNKLAKIAGGPEIAGGKKDAVENRLQALTSYVEIPVELLRQQMLDLARNQ